MKNDTTFMGVLSMDLGPGRKLAYLSIKTGSKRKQLAWLTIPDCSHFLESCCHKLPGVLLLCLYKDLYQNLCSSIESSNPRYSHRNSAPQIVVFAILFVYRLNKQDTMCKLMSLRGACRCIFELWREQS